MPANQHPLAFQRLILEIARVGVTNCAICRPSTQRMLERYSRAVLLPVEPLSRKSLGDCGKGRSSAPASRPSRNNESARSSGALGGLAGGHRVVERRQQLAGVPEPVIAPTLIRHSITRLLTSRKVDAPSRSRTGDRKSPPSFRAAIIDSIAPSPTFFTASSPKPDGVVLDRELTKEAVDVGAGGHRSRAAGIPPPRPRPLLVVAEGRQHATSCSRPCSSPLRYAVWVGDQPVAGGMGPC